MAVSAADVARLRQHAGQPGADHHLAELQTIAEVLGYAIELARAEDEDEADVAELLVRSTDMHRGEIREAERVLRPLGYAIVADRLHSLLPQAKPAPRR